MYKSHILLPNMNTEHSIFQVVLLSIYMHSTSMLCTNCVTTLGGIS